MTEAELKKAIKQGTIGIIVFILVILALLSFKTIKSGEVGLKVRFGKIVDTSLKEGLNLKLPLIEKIVKVNIKVQKAELQTESSSKDLQTIKTMLAVNYRVDSEMAVSLYKTVGNSYEETVLTPAIQESIKSVMSQYTAEQTITKRNEVSDNCLKEIQEKVEKYGIKIEDFNIIDLDFSDAYNQAIEEKQVAEQKVLTAQQELERTKIEKEKKIVEAQGTKEANEILNSTLTNQNLTKQFIDKWNGQLPSAMGDENIMKVFGLDK